MRKVLLTVVSALLALSVNCWVYAKGGVDMAKETQVRVIFEDKEAIVSMLDNSAARDFVSLLPLTVTLEDYASAEKIYYLPRKLDVSSGQNAEQVKGDFCYYAPWGNLAIFYKGMGHSTSLYVLGRLESGKEDLAAMGKSFKATIELVR